MSNRNRSLRIVALTVIVALATVAITATWATAWAESLGFVTPTTQVAPSEAAPVDDAPMVTGTCESLPGGVIEVEGTGGSGTQPTGYATLAAAFTAINGGVHTGTIVVDVCGDTSEGTATATLNASGSGSASYTSIAMSPAGGAARSITGTTTAGSPMIDFSGADNVTINGLNTGGNSLTIANGTVSATSGTSTIRFIGGATGNTITNSNIQGSGTMSVATNGATIFFSTDAVTTNGNDNNTISNNNIGPVGINPPSKGILCNGSTTTQAIGNSGLIIDNNNIFDYFGAAVTSAGVAVNGGCNTFSVTNNRFYQTGTRTWTTGARHTPILMDSSAATSGVQGMTITGNIIGFASNTQTGTYTLTGSTGQFQAIRFNGITTGTVSNINNNTIAAVSLTGVTSSGTTTSSPFAAVMINNGLVNTNSNIIGSQSVTGSLTFSTNTTTATDVFGFNSFASDNWTATNNQIGGITGNNAGASGAFRVIGMRADTLTSATWTLTSNLVGGTVANSIQNNSVSTTAQTIGIASNGSTSPISNLTSNTIRNLTAAGGTGTTSSASVIGFVSTITTPNHTLSQNTIHTLSNTSTTAASIVTGIQFTGGTANVVERNFIYNLLAPTTSTSAEINGIRVAGGTTIYRNNMIALGANQAISLGSTATNSGTTGINGINEALGTNSFFHNSVYIGGTSASGTGSSYAFNGTQTVNTRSFRDNIFFNARTNTGGSGGHVAIKLNGTTPNPTGLTINNNVYFVNGVGGATGFYNGSFVSPLSAWRTAVGQDVGSFESNPQFNDPTNAVPDLHLHPTNATVAEGNGVDVGVTLDFDGQTRSGLTPVDIGADAGNFTGVDLSAPNITYTPLANTVSTANRTQTVTITDATGVATGGVSPRLYYRKNGAGAYTGVACNLMAGTVQNGTWDCVINNTPIGGVVAGNTVDYFVVAQDTLGNLAANPNAGFVGTDVNTISTTPTNPNVYTILAEVSSFPYSQNFDAGPGGYTTSIIGGSVNDWVLGTPAKTSIAAAHTAPNAWVTQLTTSYSNNHNASVNSPVFNFTNRVTPVVTFWQNFDTEVGWDAGILEMSTDGGGSWNKVDPVLGTGGTFNTATSTGWYNSNSSNGPIAPPKWSGISTAYTGHAAGWIQSTTTLTGAGGLADVRLRWRYGSDSSGIDEGWAIDDVSIVAPAIADLSISKTDGSATEIPGTTVIYSIVASNSGPGTATNVTVADTFNAPLGSCSTTSVAAGGASGNDAGPVAGSFSDGGITMPSGSSVSYTVQCNIDPAATGSLVNTATVSSPDISDGTPGNNTAVDTDTLNPTIDVNVIKTDGVTQYNPGGTLTYTITTSNAGPSTATGVTVADTFPAVLTCSTTSSAAGGATGNDAGPIAGNISDSGITMPPTSTVTHTSVCNVSPGATGTLANTASATYGGGLTDANPGNDSSTDTDTQAVAAGFVVDTLTDNGALNACTAAAGDCSLRGAILNANANPAADTITFDPSVAGGTITLGGTSLDIVNSGSLTITGPSAAVTVNGNGTSRVFTLPAGAVVSMSDLRIIGGTSNVAGDGGGIVANGNLTLDRVAVSGNTATGAAGGGIFCGGVGSLTISNSTISGNNAGGNGGAINLNCSGASSLTNSTLSGNSTSSNGGGLFGAASTTITIRNSTIANNFAPGGSGGGIYQTSGSSMNMGSTIVAGNSAFVIGPDIFAGTAITTAGFNFIGNNSNSGFVAGTPNGNNDYSGTSLDPLLGPLANNGGPTQTHALNTGSQAINTGANALALSFDQRGTGFARVVGAAADIGAFEVQTSPIVVVNGTGVDDTLIINATSINGGSYTLNGGPAVPLTGVTSFTFNGLGGNDTLTVNNPSGGLFAPTSGIDFNGGGQAGDNINLLGGQATSETYFVGTTTPPIGAGPGNNGDGLVRFTGPALDIRFTGLAPMVSTVAAAVFTVNATDAANTISITNAPVFPRLRIAVDAFEPDDIDNKAQIFVNGGDGTAGGDVGDTITVNYTNTPAAVTSIQVSGNEGDDSITTLARSGSYNLFLNGNENNDQINAAAIGAGPGLIILDGGDGGDALVGGADDNVFDGGPGDDTFLGNGGTDNVGGGTGTSVDDRVLAPGTAAGDTITLAGNGLGQVLVTINGLTTTYGNFIGGSFSTSGVESIDVNADAGNDNINVTVTPSGYNLNLNGGDNDDNIDASATVAGPNAISYVGGLGNDTIIGGGDDEVFDGGEGDDTFIGNGGTDNVGAGATASVFDRILVPGTAGNDTINLSIVSGELVVAVNAVTTIYRNFIGGPIATAGLELVLVNAGANPDIINVNSTEPTLPTTINGEAGNDAVNLADGVSLNGGTIDGGADTDALFYSAFTTPVSANLGLSTTGMAGTLLGNQEVPQQFTTAEGTVSVTNYNAVSRTFDISVSVTNLLPADVTGFHIHRAQTGTNGPIIVNLLPLAPLVPAGSGFTFSATGVTMPSQHEAAFLGGVTYVNIHTAAAPGGLIRAQVFSNGNVNLASGTATGTGGVSGIENLFGGTMNDSIVGSFAANSINGQGGDDTILGGPGGDTMLGGNNNDTLIWSNGDGSDIIDGNNDTDTVQVNGLVAADDVFNTAANVTRLAFSRINTGLFTLDIGTSEALVVNGIGGNDTFGVNSMVGIADITSVGLFGFDGNDTFNVVPAPNPGPRLYHVSGGRPTTYGDVLNIDQTGVTGGLLTLDAQGNGTFTSTNCQTITINGIEPQPTTTTVTSSANPSVFGQNVTFTATVAAVPPGNIPTGTVQFVIDGVPAATVALNGSGVATYSTSTLTVGNHSVVANYSGSALFASSSGTLAGGQNVGQANTTTTVTASPSTQVFGASVTFTATVAPVAPGAGTPTGTVTFNIDGNLYCVNTPLNGSSQASCTQAGLPALPAGVRNVVAIYSGNANFNGSAGTLNYTVTKANTTTTITADTPDPSLIGQPYTVSFSVAANPAQVNSGTPTGSVTISDGTGGTCTGTVAAGSCQLTSTTIGNKTLVATYAGDNNFNTSTSLGVPHVVNVGISGTVRDGATLAPIAGVSVTLFQLPGGAPITSATTNAAGQYTIAGQFTAPVGVRPTTIAPPYYDPAFRNIASLASNVTGQDFLSYPTVADIPRNLRFINQYVTPGDAGVMPVILSSQDNEVSVAFSITYNTNLFSQPPVFVCGAQAPGCTITQNTSVFGSVGVTITPAGGAFSRTEEAGDAPEAPGIKEIARMNFQTAVTANVPATTIGVTGNPTSAVIFNSDGNPLLWSVTQGNVVFQLGPEGDVATRNSGNGVLDAADMVQMRRFVAGLDTAFVNSANEYQRADTAPSNTKGNGVLDATDLVQARRYVAGLDAPQSSGGPGFANQGPAAPPADGEVEGAARAARRGDANAELTIGNAGTTNGTRVTVPVSLSSAEAVATSFTVRYDEQRFASPQVTLAAGAESGITLTSNTNERGVIRILLDSQSSIAAKDGRTLIELTFDVIESAPSGSALIEIVDLVVSDAEANAIGSKAARGTITITGPNPEIDDKGAKARDLERGRERERERNTPFRSPSNPTDLVEHWLNYSTVILKPRFEN